MVQMASNLHAEINAIYSNVNTPKHTVRSPQLQYAPVLRLECSKSWSACMSHSKYTVVRTRFVDLMV